MVKEKTFVFFCLCFCHLVGVFADELKSVSVMEGGSVTLQTDLTELQTDDAIKWMFGTNRILIARISASTIIIPDDLDGRFRDRLKPDKKTGSLTITNIRPEHAGDYEADISRKSSSYKHRFNVTVNATPTTTPTTTTTTTKLPSASNSSSGHTSSNPPGPPVSQTELILAASAGFLLIVAALVIFFIYRKHRKTDQQETVEAREEEVTYADTTFVKRKAPSVKQEEDVVYAGIVTGR